MKFFIKKSLNSQKLNNCRKSRKNVKIVNRYFYLFWQKKSSKFGLEKTGFCNIKNPVKTKAY